VDANKGGKQAETGNCKRKLKESGREEEEREGSLRVHYRSPEAKLIKFHMRRDHRDGTEEKREEGKKKEIDDLANTICGWLCGRKLAAVSSDCLSICADG
jgi:hypothetical protein